MFVCLWISDQDDYDDPSSNIETHTYSGLRNIAASTDTVAPSAKLYVKLLMYQCNIEALLSSIVTAW